MKTHRYLTSLIAILIFHSAFSQQKTAVKTAPIKADNTSAVVDSSKQKDLVDVVEKLLYKKAPPKNRNQPAKANFSIIPYGGYTLSTGFSANLSGNVGFYSSPDHNENFSVLAADISYDSKSQAIFLTRSEIWANQNNFKLVSDLRWERYPTETYGLGTFSTFNTDDHLNFYYTRIYETLLTKVEPNFYAGIGYNLDYHYHITAEGNMNGTVSDFQKYGQTTSSTSSGLNFDFLFDDRKNPLNPLGGYYASVIFRQNTTFLGSNSDWQSLQLDFRRYLRLSQNSNNVLAFWTMAAFTYGNTPYLDLPSTGSDMYNNSGRGYATGRFRGRNMLYFESEYRFGLTPNGLLGAVVFANAESFSESQSNTFQRIAPAAGTGIRIKINKHSNSNICIDYGVGVNGSHGFFVNLGEVF